MADEHLLVLTTTDSDESANALAKSAVAARVAACVQVDGPIISTYWWEGAVQADQEWRVLFKTTTDRYADLEAHIKANHSYDVPEIIATAITAGSAAYLGWVTEETTPR
ncbi:MAG: divalent-cation tolerance protein CutA [Streptomycetaceae bacterium]|nr:divalent-cation tolerance protein CutA [Streptomycetaceae bacterium]